MPEIRVSGFKEVKGDWKSFNVLIDFEEEGSFLLTGYRTKFGKIYPPGIAYGKNKYFQTGLLPKIFAEAIYGELLSRGLELKGQEEAIQPLLCTEEAKQKFIYKDL